MWRFLPGPAFPSIRIGGECQLMCDHCRGEWLMPMRPAGDPDSLLDLGMALADRGGVGMLVSGGFDSDGRLPIGPFLPALRDISERTDLIINVHTGLVDEREAGEIADAGIRIASLDLIGSERTIREIYHLERVPGDLLASARRLMDAGLEVVPHITLGLHGGKLLGERRALGMAVDLSPRVLIVNALMDGPLPGMAGPPLDLMEETRGRFSGRLVLGCMYPRGRGFPEAAEAMGFDGAVGPGPGALEGCCALAARDEWLGRLQRRDGRK
ncbi:MAG: hypothetical protein L0Z54_00220 [Thermoplasmata archaeon]|nr:hypothetical protein [Thermoplasmata archaeon]